MTQAIKRHSSKLLAAGSAAGLLVLCVMAFSSRETQSPTAREIVLVARDIAFRLPDHPGKPNPVLALKRGQPVKLVLRNDEPNKVLHCFTIGGLGVKTSRDLAAGESEALIFTPRERGTFAYACLMHPTMSGQLIVE